MKTVDINNMTPLEALSVLIHNGIISALRPVIVRESDLVAESQGMLNLAIDALNKDDSLSHAVLNPSQGGKNLGYVVVTRSGHVSPFFDSKDAVKTWMTCYHTYIKELIRCTVKENGQIPDNITIN